MDRWDLFGGGGRVGITPMFSYLSILCAPDGRSLESKSRVLSWRVQGWGLEGGRGCPLELKGKGFNIHGHTTVFDSSVYPFRL